MKNTTSTDLTVYVLNKSRECSKHMAQNEYYLDLYLKAASYAFCDDCGQV